MAESAEPRCGRRPRALYLKELAPCVTPACSSRAYAAFTASQSPSKLRDAAKLLPPHVHSTTKLEERAGHLRRVADRRRRRRRTG